MRFQSNSAPQEGSQFIDKILNTFRFFCQSQALKPFLILHFFNTIQVFCGLSIFTYYAIDILTSIRKTEDDTQALSENVSGIIVSLVRIPVSTLATLLLVRVGRRTIALISGVGSSLSALLLTFSLYHTGMLFPANYEHWVNFISLLSFVSCSAFGFFLLPAIMLGETQPSQIRGIACGYIYTMNDIVLGAVLKGYPAMMQHLEVKGIFLLFAMSCLLCTVFIYIFLPETQGKTLEEIEDYFKLPNIMWITRERKINFSL